MNDSITITPEKAKKLIRILDSRDQMGEYAKSISTFNCLLGEDLCISAYLQYQQSERGKNVKEIDFPFTGIGHKKKLDAWLTVDSKLYQTEVKNWSSYSLGGCVTGISDVDCSKNSNQIWENQYEYCLNDKSGKYKHLLNKVFSVYIYPDGYSVAFPLLIIWDPASPNKEDPLCPENIYMFEDHELKVFSVSLYFRKLIRENKTVTLELKRFTEKFRLILEIIGC